MIDRGKRSMTLSEVKSVKNINKNLQRFLEISPVQKEVLLSHKLQGHAYEYQNLFKLKEDNLSQRNCQNQCANMAVKLPWYFYLLMEKPLGCYSKFGLHTIRQHSATRKHFQYPQGNRSGLRKPKKDKHQH